jgi:hypothetical protein
MISRIVPLKPLPEEAVFEHTVQPCHRIAKTTTKPKTPEPEPTPAYLNGFSPNTKKLSYLLKLGQKALKNDTAQVKTYSAAVVGLSGKEQAEKIRTAMKELAKQSTELSGGLLVVYEVLPVLFVTIVEAYLKDVLIYAAGIDASLMEGSGQTVTYEDARNAKSLEEVLIELRRKRARKFVDNGGPTTWIETLKRWGAKGYRPETAGKMETLWGVRHLVIHSAGVVNADFVRRHPELKAEVGKPFKVNNTQIKQWFATVFDFVGVTDRYFARRCQKSPQRG